MNVKVTLFEDLVVQSQRLGIGSDPGQGGEEPPEKWLAAAEDMLKSGNGAIVNVLSLSVQTGGANGAGAYAVVDRHLDCVIHHHRISGMPPAGDVGRGDMRNNGFIHTDSVGPEAFTHVRVQIDRFQKRPPFGIGFFFLHYLAIINSGRYRAI